MFKSVPVLAGAIGRAIPPPLGGRERGEKKMGVGKEEKGGTGGRRVVGKKASM